MITPSVPSAECCLLLLVVLLLLLLQVQRKYEAADSRAASAATCVSDLKAKLGAAEDQIVALEGHVSVLEEELAKYTQLPQ